jgi:adenosyl cobinamide kinase/adenosyl cobinamide phosphate guanylyltransferase
MGKKVLITGGARSGKSAYALDAAAKHEGPRAFIATMEPLDEETAERIRRHRAERGDGWETFEEPLEVAALMGRLCGSHEVVVLDCLTLWLSNVMRSGRDVEAEVEGLVGAVKRCRPKGALVVVTNEVGMGIVPENELARRFRDLAGMLNRKAAAEADEAYLVVSGLPVKIKGDV